ncbi:MAG TPA: hypothetical protein VFB37_07225 [Steroidobacteraceae bacterium]|nr:hypothetical protein [Steroidobacteraceae bacterium]
MHTTRVRGFATYEPRDGAKALIDSTKSVLRQYKDYLPLTLRQIFYRLVTMDVIGKTEKDYKRLGEILNRARRGRLIAFAAIRDDGVVTDAPASYGSVDDALATLRGHIASLQIDRQAGQPRRMRIWCEAAGMVPQLTRVAHEYGISVMSSGGFDSVTIKHHVGQELAESGRLTVLHLGDLDPSGEHVYSSLDEDVRSFAKSYGGDVDFTRIAVTAYQVHRYGLPTSPPKATDRRSFSGTATTQCEALDPATLAQIVRDAIRCRLDPDAYASALEYESECRAELTSRLAR